MDQYEDPRKKGSPVDKGAGALSTAICRMSVGVNGHARWVPEGTDKKSPTFFAQRTNSTDIEPPRSAKKTAFVRGIACQSRKSGLFSPARPRNEASQPELVGTNRIVRFVTKQAPAPQALKFGRGAREGEEEGRVLY